MPDQPATVRLALHDAIELRELLEFLSDWLDDANRAELSTSLTSFTSGGYGVADLQVDLARFALLLGDDGEQLHGLGRHP